MPDPITVTLPAALVRLFPGAVPEVDLQASSLRELIDALDARWPGMRDRLCDSRPCLRRHIIVYVDGARATLETRLAAGAAVIVTTALVGG